MTVSTPCVLWKLHIATPSRPLSTSMKAGSFRHLQIYMLHDQSAATLTVQMELWI